MSDNIHKTHFPVTKEMPWREKEKKAILLCQKLIDNYVHSYSYDEKYAKSITEILNDNKDLVEWIMKYNG